MVARYPRCPTTRPIGGADGESEIQHPRQRDLIVPTQTRMKTMPGTRARALHLAKCVFCHGHCVRPPCRSRIRRQSTASSVVYVHRPLCQVDVTLRARQSPLNAAFNYKCPRSNNIIEYIQPLSDDSGSITVSLLCWKESLFFLG